MLDSNYLTIKIEHMKPQNILRPIFAIIMAFFLVIACTDDFEDMNTDPRLVTSDLVNVNHLLTNVQVSLFIGQISTGVGGTTDAWAGMATRHDSREFGEGDSPGTWNTAYGTRLNNLSNIIHLTEDDPDLVNKTAIARIMRAHAVSILTDTYGDVPYYQACLRQEEAVYQPYYDAQKDIYEDLFKELREAAAQLDPAKESYGAADLVYGGNVELWKKFANSLRLRLALRIRYADASMAQAAISDLTEANLITTNGESASAWTNAAQPEHRNPRFNRIENNPGTIESVHAAKTMIDILLNNDSPRDPRIGIYADTARATFPGTPGYEDIDFFGYRGEPLLGNSPAEYKYPWQLETCSRISRLWEIPVIERVTLGAAEVFFSLAEARLFGLINWGDANDFYQRGIDAHIKWSQDFYELAAPQLPEVLALAYPSWNEEQIQEHVEFKAMKDEEIAAFKAAPVYSLSGTPEEQLEQIINQKIVALYPDGFQGWAEKRRTGYPRLLIGPDTDHLRGQIARKYPWPEREELVNSANWNEVIQRNGGENTRLVRFWWDANPNPNPPHPGTLPTRPTAWQ